jgi:hypothetical protein
MLGIDKAAMKVMMPCVQNAARLSMRNTLSKVGKVDGIPLGVCPKKKVKTTQLTTAFVCVQGATLN